MATAVMFSGQGAQEVGMGQSLFDQSPSVRALYETADRVLGWSLTKVSFEGPADELVQTRVCQPALFVHGCALFRLLEEAGETADVTVTLGLSLGEVTALTAAGAFDFETGLRVVAERGRLMQEACEHTTGTMASIIGEEITAIEALCAEFDIQVANLNCPGQVVVSGEKSKVEAALAGAKDRGFRRVVPLKVAGAYHSRLMEPARAAFESFLRDVPVNVPRIHVLTNTTGRVVEQPDAIRAALVRQVVSPVRWEDCMREAAALGATQFLELGPGKVLASLARRTDKSWPVKSLSGFADLAA